MVFTEGVAPYTGAWIEIRKEWVDPACWKVAPYTGAWIEIRFRCVSTASCRVAPYTGAWIEIRAVHRTKDSKRRRSLHGSVD